MIPGSEVRAVRAAAGLAAALALAVACGSSSSDPAPSPTLSATPSPPSATPKANAYRLDELIGAEALGEAAEYKTEMVPIPDVGGEALIALQTGPIYRVSLDGSFEPQPWGDLSQLVNFDGNEEGLLSVAFSPDFAEDSTVFAYYSQGSPEETVLSRFEATRTELDIFSRETVIEIEEHDFRHQGGHIVFDEDGYLLLSLGDGGFSGDALEVAQELDRLLGKVIRIDVSTHPYAIPPDNPFVGVEGAREEVYALGFRNPWRMTLDGPTGDIWLGDVGEGTWEEVNRVEAGGNYGWDCLEGLDPWETDEQCAGKEFIEPRAVYSHDKGSAIVGGYVYRGDVMPELYGWYVYADYTSGRVWALNTADDSEPVQLLRRRTLPISSFAELPDRELAIVSYVDGIYQIVRE